MDTSSDDEPLASKVAVKPKAAKKSGGGRGGGASKNGATPEKAAGRGKKAAAGSAGKIAGKKAATKKSATKGKGAGKGKGKKSEDRKPPRKFEKIGQRHDVPDERDPSRMFYESLLHENPDSEMALFWCMEHGILDDDVTLAAYQRKQGLSPSRKRSAASTPTAAKKIKTEKGAKAVAGGGRDQSSEKAARGGGKGKKVQVKKEVKKEVKEESDSDDDAPLSFKIKN